MQTQRKSLSDTEFEWNEISHIFLYLLTERYNLNQSIKADQYQPYNEAKGEKRTKLPKTQPNASNIW